MEECDSRCALFEVESVRSIESRHLISYRSVGFSFALHQVGLIELSDSILRLSFDDRTNGTIHFRAEKRRSDAGLTFFFNIILLLERTYQ